MSATAQRRIRRSIRVEGTVQGVGFRPFVYRLARELDLDGHVFNDAAGVQLEVEGSGASVERFLDRLRSEAPPLAVIERVHVAGRSATGADGFAILASPRDRLPDAPIAADSATCEDCLRELLDPHDRRYRYPFINCTNCGPRFTIVRGIPYDRPYTTMASFRMCPLCQAEYDDPSDRRFHAQPNACAQCGPKLKLLDARGHPVAPSADRDLVQTVAAALRDGAVVAVKGIGGYHLACRADHEQAVAALRARKHREDKPFALMVADVEGARALVELGAEEEQLLRSAARPIVLAPRRASACVAAAVAPGMPELGVMLPYTPLHRLLLGDCGGPLVMTSGNVSDEPIAYRDDDALERLSGIADLLLFHDRPIETRTDDSVARAVGTSTGKRPQLLRRSRGYVPAALELPVPSDRAVLACGAEQKSTFCVAKGARAWISHHIGDLEHFATHVAFREGIDHFKRLFSVSPQLVVHDMHPGYRSTTYAQECENIELLAVQHHHAHLAACLAEHGRVHERAVGLIFDGTGCGIDGTVWGGELLIGDLNGFVRAGHLRSVALPGGAAAIREPWRMAAAWMHEAFGESQELPRSLAGKVSPKQWGAMPGVARLADVSPVTSSVGRLFDAVGVLCGLSPRASYEGQAAVELEALARSGDGVRQYEIELADDASLLLDPRAAIRAICGDLCAGAPEASVARGFHLALARASCDATERLARAAGLATVVLSGGVFQNRLLLEAVSLRLEQAGLEVLTPLRLPPNDGGISFGQAAIAAVRGGPGV
jgi:hydrogenase maturation protein HypF